MQVNNDDHQTSRSTQQSTNRRIEIDALKALAIIGVVFIHVPPKSHFTDSTYHLLSAIQNIFGWCVVAFFYASGLLTKKIDFFSFRDFISYAKSRAARLILPCVLLSIFYKTSLYGLWKLGFIESRDYSFSFGIHELISFIITPVGPQFYFLIYLYLIEVVLYPLSRFIGGNLLLISSIVVCFFVFISRGMMLLPLPMHGPLLLNIPLYVAAYLIGMANPCRSLIYIVLLGVIISIAFNFEIFIFLFPLFFVVFCRKTKLIHSQCLLFLAALGRRSYSIYLWHAPILISAITMFVTYLCGGKYFSLFVTVIITIIFSILIGELVKKLKFTRKIGIC